MKRFRPLHKIYGGLRIIRVCRHWPKWFQEYFSGLSDGSGGCYRMRCGIDLYTRRNRSDFHMTDEEQLGRAGHAALGGTNELEQGNLTEVLWERS